MKNCSNKLIISIICAIYYNENLAVKLERRYIIVIISKQLFYNLLQ